ncbi:S-adenosyl-L-methionine-dependent methyltransferase [Thelonectria olida]|uniref:S-adenosyl-L-methionine-dependent methyltransferase n=1 Tax=Thelonectria olida TaxID=1576542 RepID=A0A9P8WAN0_9HYPO|nr:S-adenosyl-L-methionine-dependent methyltransferase [Thelonectria olida]
MTALEHFDASAASYEANTAGCTVEVMEKCLSLLPEIDTDSVVLDNACGTGLSTHVLLRTLKDGSKPTIHVVDGAPKMVEISRKRFEAYENIHAKVAPGEDLSAFSDGTFSHSVTNMGLFFFADASKGARELFRTLAPGGTAVVTGWSDLGHLDSVHRVQKAIRPEDKPFQLPIAKEWFDLGHMKQVLSEAGFGTRVETSEVTAHWAADNLQDLVQNMTTRLAAAVMKEWTDEEKKKAEELFPEAMKPKYEEFTRSDGTKAVGLKMRAYIALCKK